MASVDTKRGHVVIRLVYDGPAWAGKTTTLRALAKTLGCEAYSGAEEDGRTLHFDWVDYVGGLFEGMPIRCQIVAVPGQRVLERRRRLLLSTADVVVFVADSRPDRASENVASFALLRRVIGAADLTVGIVVQANKRDVPGAVSLDELRERLGDTANLAMTEAVASRGEGIRESFVLAVRLALDRTRAQWHNGSLTRGVPAIDSSEQLLEAVLEAEKSGHTSTEEKILEHQTSPTRGAVERRAPMTIVPRGSRVEEPQANRTPALPDTQVPAGLVWPPVSGRVTVHEAARDSVRLKQTNDGESDGEWLGVGSSGTWRLLSPAQGLFVDLDEGRNALIDWARWHTLAGTRLTLERAIVLASAAPGAWRLWQIVRRRNTLLDLCRVLVTQRESAVGEGLFRILDLRLRAEHSLVDVGWVPKLELDSVTASASGEPAYAGFVPYPPLPRSEPPRESTAQQNEWISSELADTLRHELSITPSRLQAVLAGVDHAAAVKNRPQIARLVRTLLLGA